MSKYDYIIVGGGSAGCAVAGRLSRDADCRVLLIEAGGSDRTTFCRKPGMIAIVHTVPQIKKKFDWGYYTNPRKETLKRKIPYIRGKVLGGSSAINGMIFVRGHRANFDSWAEDDGCEGWSYEEILPYYKRMESFEDGASAYRGGDGPVHVTRHHEVSPVTEAFIDAVSDVCRVDITDDYNAYEQEGVGKVQMSARDGVRYSSSEAYVHPAMGRPNFDVVLGAQVTRIVIEKGRATGVEYIQGDRTVVAHAAEEIILSAGVIGSAQILMLSGVGPAAHLKEHGIDVVSDLPVGQNLHDHLFFPLVFLAPRGGHQGTPLHFLGGMLQEYLLGKTWFGKTLFESVAFVKTDASQPIPDLQLHSMPWAYPAPNQDKPGRPDVDMRPALTVQPTLIYPRSRGEVLLTSGDPLAAPLIDPHYLEEEADVDFLLRSIELTREIMASSSIAGELSGELEPGPKFFQRDAMRKELPNRVCTVYHPVGTCRMGVDERAVVDPQLRVLGVEGLRVADAAIMPTIIGGNTNAPCMMIGEKCADLILEAQR
ncbi:MAG: choline dehydrogenase [Myxococcales bacterium]|nr:choline dehydrogenase [Myxococcales bacterium]